MCQSNSKGIVTELDLNFLNHEQVNPTFPHRRGRSLFACGCARTQAKASTKMCEYAWKCKVYTVRVLTVGVRVCICVCAFVYVHFLCVCMYIGVGICV